MTSNEMYASINPTKKSTLRSRLSVAVESMQSAVPEFEELENELGTAKAALKAETEKLKREVTNRKLKLAIKEAVAACMSDEKGVLSAKVEELEQELGAAKAQTVVAEESRRQLAVEGSGIAKLKQGLKKKKVKGAVSKDAKKELEELKAQLVKMIGSGPKGQYKSGQVE
ncbi:hypothetical protein G6011_06894 [Alternaria panax]|uniref:Uncharacterized protein n=1 Tax=Alternaria panax TaxID=48097 RepID=A0AAD4I4L2_9PLEO|nr:hypothetical protein G6011_06894 [Alternaria panax]